ncbi:MAG: short chain dehydrogenase [Symbiobacteriaceae bacterium]|jgi:3-oxoacyl-[acyl-carrier protein] reductase|nr:short chain dehydrogenase [Symbiobacteriaceae bacterium]
MQTGLAGKVALVTAASKGLGLATALGLAIEGCDLAICSRDEAAIAAAAEQIRQATGRRVLALTADVSQSADIERLLQATFAEYGGIDILVSNTGGPPTGMFMDFDDAAWQKAFDNLLMSAVRLTRGVIPSMKARGGGRIIYITSGSVKQPIAALVLSNALRSGVTAMAKTLAAQVAKDGITVNCVAPGRIDTERIKWLDNDTAARTGRTAEAAKADWEAKIPAGRYGTPEEFANAVVFLVSEGASYMTGSTLVVDGGHINTLL